MVTFTKQRKQKYARESKTEVYMQREMTTCASPESNEVETSSVWPCSEKSLVIS